MPTASRSRCTFTAALGTVPRGTERRRWPTARLNVAPSPGASSAWHARRRRAQDRRTAADPPVPPDANSGLSAFCKGAGIAADHFAPELQVRLLQLAGQLIREALVGLKDLERARTEALRPMQIDTPATCR